MQFVAFVPGLVLESGPREVGAQEIIDFGRRYDPQACHVNARAATTTLWGGLIASGWMTCGIAMELAARAWLAGSRSMGSPGIVDLRWEHPVRPGDRLSLTATVLESRRSSSGRIGILRWRWELHNAAAERVLSLVATSFFDITVP